MPGMAEVVTDEKHPVDRMLPVGRLVVLGLQHVLVMYAGCVAVPLIVGGTLGLSTDVIAILVNADLFVAGLITIVQSLGIGKILGVRLPIVAGATFTALSPMILIGGKYGMPAVYGSMLAAGVFGLLIAKPFAKIIHLFPPLVTGTVITVIGLSLIDAGAGLIAGNDESAPGYGSLSHLALAASIILLIVLINRFARGFLVSLAVLIGLIFGVIVAAFMGLVDFSAVGAAGWLGLARPFYFGAPEFPVAAVISKSRANMPITTACCRVIRSPSSTARSPISAAAPWRASRVRSPMAPTPALPPLRPVSRAPTISTSSRAPRLPLMA